MQSTLKLITESETAYIVLNRPEKRNAISPQMIDELLASFDIIEASPARVVIITGEGKAFCAGLDLELLKQAASKSYEENLTEFRRLADLFRRLWGLSKPTIAAVNGPAQADAASLHYAILRSRPISQPSVTQKSV